MANQHLDTPWTQDRVEELRRLWAEGYSASEIADALGETSRCAVLGKINRLELSRRKPLQQRKLRDKNSRRRPVFIAPKDPPPKPPPLPPRPEPEIIVKPAPPKPRRLTLMQLAEHHCRWPVEGPPLFRFCGAHRSSGDPYCRYHLDKAFAKPRGPR